MSRRAFGPKSIGALKLLNDWIDDDVGEWLVTHEKEEFLDEDSGMPVTAVDHGDAKVKSEAGADGAGDVNEEKAGEEGKGLMSPAAKSTVSYFTKKGKRMQKIASVPTRCETMGAVGFCDDLFDSEHLGWHYDALIFKIFKKMEQSAVAQ